MFRRSQTDSVSSYTPESDYLNGFDIWCWQELIRWAHCKTAKQLLGIAMIIVRFDLALAAELANVCCVRIPLAREFDHAIDKSLIPLDRRCIEQSQ